jgi:preprotein translocase subunit SecE
MYFLDFTDLIKDLYHVMAITIIFATIFWLIAKTIRERG